MEEEWGNTEAEVVGSGMNILSEPTGTHARNQELEER